MLVMRVIADSEAGGGKSDEGAEEGGCGEEELVESVEVFVLGVDKEGREDADGGTDVGE